MFVILGLAVLYWGFYFSTAVSCWHRGGTPLVNAFGWPSCVNPVRP